MRELKRNVTVKAVTRLCKTQFVKRKTIANYDDCIKRMRRSGKHTITSDSKDFATVLNKLDGLDIHSLYKWIGDHKKYIALRIQPLDF